MLKEAIKLFKEYDEELTKIKIITNLSNQEMKEIADKAYCLAQELGIATMEALNKVIKEREKS